MTVREAMPAELDDWDRHTVEVEGGDVLQSIAWGRYRGRHGWTPAFLVLGDGARVLGLRRSGRVVRPDFAYLSRGPIPGDPPETTARRLGEVTDWYSSRGVGRLVADPEIPAESGYGRLIAALGFRQVEEIQPSRHRLSLDLSGVTDPEQLMRSFSTDTRSRLRAAIRGDLVVEAFSKAGPGTTTAARQIDLADLRDRLAAHHDLVAGTGRRKGFAVAPKDRFVEWSAAAYAAGWLVHVEVRTPGRELVAASIFYRHGRRWTYALASDDPRFRHAYPGAVRLVLWEAIIRALEEGRTEMDLGGVDVRGARRKPDPGEPEHGMLTFKESFGARWLELTGAHEMELPAASQGFPGLVRRLVAR